VDLYNQKKRWKVILSVIALLIISASLYYTNALVGEFAREERNQVRVWADAVQRKASLMHYTESFFAEVRKQERHRVELLANTYKRVLTDTASTDLTFYSEIISNNKSIPVIWADEDGRILSAANLHDGLDTIKRLEGKLLNEFSVYEPITIQLSPARKQFLYYRESLIFTDLKKVLDDLVSSFLTEVALNSASVPVIITDSTGLNVIQFGNLDEQRMKDPGFVDRQLKIMASENNPIEIDFLDHGKTFIYYKSSDLLQNMRYFPLLQILVIALFLLIAYLLFSYARRAEQNQVWAGMAKETAHQIGTPLSSLMAWIELMKLGGESSEQALTEMDKDIQRLEAITERFSKIGSPPVLEPVAVISVLEETLNYLRSRTSEKIKYELKTHISSSETIPLNEVLFRWVIENLCKNSIDAMSGHGKITIEVKREGKALIIDVTDTGKGISKSEFNSVFNPGYTSKKRGWGLGLTLARRIITEYHKGKIFVKQSIPGDGTTFRISLRSNHNEKRPVI
jgi:two-component sensor histidine kinase